MGSDAHPVHTFRDGTLCTHGLAQAWHLGSRAKEGGGQCTGRVTGPPQLWTRGRPGLPRGLPSPSDARGSLLHGGQGKAQAFDSPCRLCRGQTGALVHRPARLLWQVPGKSLEFLALSWSPQDPGLETDAHNGTRVPAQPAQQRLHHPGLPPPGKL